jgi:tRNA A37 threonylcarbamoyladenosine dehydratase
VTVTATFGLVAAGLAIDTLSKNADLLSAEAKTEKMTL